MLPDALSARSYSFAPLLLLLASTCTEDFGLLSFAWLRCLIVFCLLLIYRALRSKIRSPPFEF